MSEYCELDLTQRPCESQRREVFQEPATPACTLRRDQINLRLWDTILSDWFLENKKGGAFCVVWLPVSEDPSIWKVPGDFRQDRSKHGVKCSQLCVSTCITDVVRTGFVRLMFCHWLPLWDKMQVIFCLFCLFIFNHINHCISG